MKRVSTDMNNDNMQYYLRRQDAAVNKMQNKMAAQSKIGNLRDDPIAAAHSVVLKSNISRLKQFADNAGEIQAKGRVAEAYMRESVEILHRINELAVQGANGTYSKNETAMMAEEVDQLLKELLEISNSRYGDGTSIFAGDKALSQAFRPITGFVEGSGKSVVVNVEYTGNMKNNTGEISENAYANTEFPGSSVFWAENQVLISSRNSDGFFVKEDSAIKIDGVQVDLKAGDNIYAVISKINDSGAPVKAALDPVKNSLSLTTTEPHQLWIEDMGSGTVLQETGLIKNTNQQPPHNIAEDARMSGGSIFDTVIRLRDSLYSGNVIEIGGGDLNGIQNGLNHFISEAGKLGSRDERLQIVQDRLAYQIPEIQAMDTRETGLDLAEAITELKMLEYTHRASLQTAARVLPQTLLDFLR